MPTVAKALKNAAQILSKSGISESRREAVSLLAVALKKDKTFLIAHDDYRLSAEEELLFQKFLHRRASREPLQYIRGSQEFYGLSFIVTPAVLIPRPETELIVEHAVEILRKLENPRFCEIGVGSGCISTAILHEVKNASAIALDVSADALNIARLNAKNNLVAERILFKISDVFASLQNENFDLVVSNPPYISNSEMKNLQPEVKNFEPVQALTDGGDGYSIIERIIADAPEFLRDDGYLLMEIGFGQVEKISRIFEQSIWKNVEFIPDLQGIPRMLKAQIIDRKS